MLFCFDKKGNTLFLGIRVENIIGVRLTDSELTPAKITKDSLFDIKPTKIKGVFLDKDGNYIVETHPNRIRSEKTDKKLHKQTVKYDEEGRVSLIGRYEFVYRTDGSLYTIGRTDFDTFASFSFYRPVRYRRVGHFSLDYDVDATLKTIGDYLYGTTVLRYYSDGRIKKIRNLAITYGDNGEAIIEEAEEYKIC